MRPLLLLAASTLALTTAACAPKVPPARAALDCPATQGDLTRTSASATVCTYATSSGAEVTLQLVSTAGGVDNALSGIEATLLAGRVKPTEEAKADAKGEKGETAEKDPTKLIPPLHGALLKNEQDVHLFERLAFLARREGAARPGQ